MVELKLGSFIKVTGMEVKGENNIYIVDHQNPNCNNYWCTKVKLNGEKVASGYNLICIDEREIKKNPNIKIEVVTDLKKAKKEVNEYLKAITNEEIITTFEKSASQEVKHLDIIRFTEGLKIGTFGEKYIRSNSLWLVKFREDKTIYIEELGKKGQSISNGRMFGCTLKLTNAIFEASEVVDKIETKKGDIIAETKEEVKPAEIITVPEIVETIEQPQTESTTIVSVQETQTTNTTEFTVAKDVHTKTGATIYVAKLTKKVEREEFKSISIEIKSIGGYYSRFKNGFIFDEDPTKQLKETFDNSVLELKEIATDSEPTQIKEVQEIIINEDLARRSKQNMSFSDYKEGSATQEYNQVIEYATKQIEEAKEKVSTESQIKLDNLLTWYKKAYANWINKHNANGANHVSVMISGASNYNMSKHNKYVSREGKLWEEYNDIKDISSKIDKIVTGDKIIKSSDPNALEKLKEKLSKAEEEHKGYKDYNIKAKKEGKEKLSSYILQNSNARIKKY